MNPNSRVYSSYHRAYVNGYDNRDKETEVQANARLQVAAETTEARWREEAAKAKALCHPECSDGYCHRAYMRGPILAKD